MSELIDRFGAPDAEGDHGAGRRYHWGYAGERLASTGYLPPTPVMNTTYEGLQTSPRRRMPRIVAATCDLEVDADAAGNMVRWRAAGSACLVVLDSPHLWK